MIPEEQIVIDAALALHRAYRDGKSKEEWYPYFSRFKFACEELDRKRGEDDRKQG